MPTAPLGPNLRNCALASLAANENAVTHTKAANFPTIKRFIVSLLLRGWVGNFTGSSSGGGIAEPRDSSDRSRNHASFRETSSGLRRSTFKYGSTINCDRAAVEFFPRRSGARKNEGVTDWERHKTESPCAKYSSSLR
jgi:hypothetical protein